MALSYRLTFKVHEEGKHVAGRRYVVSPSEVGRIGNCVTDNNEREAEISMFLMRYSWVFTICNALAFRNLSRRLFDNYVLLSISLGM